MCEQCWGGARVLADGNVEIPARGDSVEEWLERKRDILRKDSLLWHTVNDLLEDYRDHADTGTDLSSVVMGPYTYSEEVFDD